MFTDAEMVEALSEALRNLHDAAEAERDCSCLTCQSVRRFSSTLLAWNDGPSGGER